MTYERLKEMIATGRKGSGSKKLARNTYAEERRPDGRKYNEGEHGSKLFFGAKGNAIAVRLHRTDILTYFADGRVRLNLGGWNTVTTRQRMNAWGPSGVRVGSDRGDTYLTLSGGWNGARYAFDGDVTLTRKGTLTRDDQRAAVKLEKERIEARKSLARTMAARRREEKRAAKLYAGVDAFMWYFGGWQVTAAKSCVETLRIAFAAAVEPYENIALGMRALSRSFEVARESDAMPPSAAFEAWHFVYPDRQANNGVGGALIGQTMNGAIPVREGQTLYVPAGASKCEYGLHASPTPSDAYGYCNGPLLCRVLCWGETETDGTKSASQYRHVVRMIDVSDIIRNRYGLSLNREGSFNQACYTRFGVQG